MGSELENDSAIDTQTAEGLRRPLDLALIESISFKSGAVAQIYRPKKKFA